MDDKKIAPLKILHVVYSLEVGGLENGVVNLINRLDPERFTQLVCCLTRSGKLAGRIERKGIEVLELGHAANSLRFPLLTLTRLFRRLAPHVVHTRGWGTVDAVFAAKLAGVPLVIHGEHGRDWKDTEGIQPRRNQIRRLVGLIVDRYVVVCDFFRRWLKDACKVRDDKIVHIPNGVDTARFYPLESAISGQQSAISNKNSKLSPQSIELSTSLQALRKQLGLPTAGILLGTVGRLDPVKDFSTLLRGFAGVRDRFADVSLAIVGDGPLRSELTKLAGDLGVGPYVYWLGERDDVPSLLRCFDLFVQTSLFEGMSNTILEAMATGLPVIATKTGGNGELVTSGETGDLIPVSSIQALAKALEKYLENPHLRQLHGLRSREKVLERFDLSLMASRYGALYENASRVSS